MAIPVNLVLAAKTDAGLVRAHNEDAVALYPEYGLAVLADGMGGYNAGEVASEMATSIVSHYLQSNLPRLAQEVTENGRQAIRRCINDAVQLANAAIVDAAQDVPQYEGMGTTLVVALFYEGIMTIAHVGDSRAYRFRFNTLQRLTRDHSLLQEQADSGLLLPEAFRAVALKNIITRAVGVDRQLEVDIFEHECRPGDFFLLCSDGLHDMLADEQIAEILAMRQEKSTLPTVQSLSATCNTLVNSANAHGGRDNISVVLMHILPGMA